MSRPSKEALELSLYILYVDHIKKNVHSGSSNKDFVD